MATARKVFGIGFHKTGTRSLRRALECLDYRVTGPNDVDEADIAETALPMAERLATRFDAFQDNPWPLLYREMDLRFPGSRFILTVRPADRWISSVVRHFGTDDTPMRQWTYGVGHPSGNEAAYVERYERHNRDVMEYFADRADDLLVLRVSEGEGWERLAPFLGHPVPDAPFPRANTAAARRRRRRPARRALRRVGRSVQAGLRAIGG